MNVNITQNIFYPNYNSISKTKITPKISFGEVEQLEEKFFINQRIIDRLASVGIVASCKVSCRKDTNKVVIKMNFYDTEIDSKSESEFEIDKPDTEKFPETKQKITEQFCILAMGLLIDRIEMKDKKNKLPILVNMNN